MDDNKKNPPSKFDYDRYTNIAFHRRGAIINETIMLERLIDDFIVNYFCTDAKKKVELMELIIGTKRMIFENKVQVFKVLLDKHFPEILEKNKTLITDIVNIVIPARNVFAHYWLVTNEEMGEMATEGITQFVKFNNSTEYIHYSHAEFQRIMMTISDCIKIVNPLLTPRASLS